MTIAAQGSVVSRAAPLSSAPAVHDVGKPPGGVIHRYREREWVPGTTSPAPFCGWLPLRVPAAHALALHPTTGYQGHRPREPTAGPTSFLRTAASVAPATLDRFPSELTGRAERLVPHYPPENGLRTVGAATRGTIERSSRTFLPGTPSPQAPGKHALRNRAHVCA